MKNENVNEIDTDDAAAGAAASAAASRETTVKTVVKPGAATEAAAPAAASVSISFSFFISHFSFSFFILILIFSFIFAIDGTFHFKIKQRFRPRYSNSTKNFKRPKNRKDSSDLDENLTETIAATQTFI